MLKSPGVKTPEGRKTTGVYLLAAVGLVNIFFPDLDPQDVQDVVQWWLDQDLTLEKILNYGYNSVTVGYFVNRLRKKVGI